MKTMETIAGSAWWIRAGAVFCLISLLGLTACSSLPQPPVRADVYDFGPGQASAPPAPAQADRGAIVVAEAVAGHGPSTDSALLYRLAYANAQQLRPYSLARWSQPPALLLTQALRARLGQEWAVLSAGGAGPMQADGRAPDVLRVELEEFSQVFDSPEASHALVRVRASLSGSVGGEARLRAQRLFVVQRPAATPDAAGGARALADAAAQVADELAQWLAQAHAAR